MSDATRDELPQRGLRDVGEMLRAADPYRGETLDPETLPAIRARLATEVPPAARFATWRLAAAVAVLAVISVWLAARDGDEAIRPPAGSRAPAVSPVPASPPPMVRAAPGPAARPVTEPVVHAAPPLPSPPNRPAADAGDRRDRTPRSIHFTAPRGTRIVWTLDPDFTLGAPQR